MHLNKYIDYVHDRHAYWCDVLKAFACEQGVSVCTTPDLFLLVDKAPRWAGKYVQRKHMCVYVIPYAISEGVKAYDPTIAHEVCHAYQNCWRLPHERTQWHGEFFHFLLRYVCKQDSGRCHPYDIKRAKLVAEFLSMKGSHEETRRTNSRQLV